MGDQIGGKKGKLLHESVKSGTIPSAAREHAIVFQSTNNKKADVHFREKRVL